MVTSQTPTKISKETPIEPLPDLTPKSKMELEVITPEIAQKYLNMAAPNRTVREGSVAQYARDMIHDNWHSSVIRFADDGKLWDGQHRLKAVILSKTEQLFWVERDVPVAAFRSVDTGIKRTMGDVLQLAGEQNSTTLATAIRYAAWLENFPGVAITGASGVPMSPDEVFQYLEKNGDIRHSVKVGQAINHSIKYPPSMAAALHYLGIKQSRPYAQQFWEQMVSGAEMVLNTGPWALHKQVVEDGLKPLGTRLDRNMLMAISIKAWNYWSHDILVKRLQWFRGAGEDFPTFGVKPKETRTQGEAKKGEK